MKDKIRIGCGAGFSGDRLDPSIVLLERGQLDYLVLECLAERTIALAQKRKRQDPTLGYDPLLERRMESLLDLLVNRRVKLITNMGAANPLAAAEKIAAIARAKKLKLRVAAVTGDDVLDLIDPGMNAMETGRPLRESGPIVSANAYLGVEGILSAIRTGADVIVTGRVADPSLFLAPMIHEFGWNQDDFVLMGQGTVIGHLMECAGHITGGYFADPGMKDVPGLASLGHPFVDVFSDGRGIVSKPTNTGGIVSLATAREQLLYEVVNPHQYFTPDVIADFTRVVLKQVDKDQVSAFGGTGVKKPDTYKVSVGYQAHWLGEGEISYGGHHALARARLAGDVIRERLASKLKDIRVDFTGYSSLHGETIPTQSTPYEVRLRVAAKAPDAGLANWVGEEVEALYTNGPAGGGGVRKYSSEVLGIVSVLLPRELVKVNVNVFES